MADPASTLFLGRVVDNEDPEAHGRVKLQRLDRPDGVLTPWARVMMPFGGNATGFMMTPEVGDLAVVAYFVGDPIVLGFVYGGTDEVVSEAVGQRRLRSKDGHTITLFDGDKKRAAAYLGISRTKIYDCLARWKAEDARKA